MTFGRIILGLLRLPSRCVAVSLPVRQPRDGRDFPRCWTPPNWELPSGPGGVGDSELCVGTLAERHRVARTHCQALSPRKPPGFGDWTAAASVLVVLVIPGVHLALRCRPRPACPRAVALGVVCSGSSRTRGEGFVAMRVFGSCH